MSAIKGDFLGFTFNGVHSSELGLIRVSDGSRYTENLFPNIQDKTVQVPGADGTYYFGSYYTQRPFNISVAFDDMTEEQFVKMRELFGDKKIHDLIFDETPYKVYRVKTNGTPNLKYVCFDKEMDDFDRDRNSRLQIKNKKQLYDIGAPSRFGRIYKGEGQLNFVCYSPFARSRFKYIDDYTVQNIPEWGSLDFGTAEYVTGNLQDWINSTKLKRSDSILTYNSVDYTLDQIKLVNTNEIGNCIPIYNPGDLPTHFNLSLVFTDIPQIYGFTLTLGDSSLKIDNIVRKGSDGGIRINGKLNLIEGIVGVSSNLIDNTPTGTIYNDRILEGDFFKIPVTDELKPLQFSYNSSGAESVCDKAEIKYDYLYY